MKNKKDYIGDNSKLIVTLSSWNKRIKNVPNTINSIFSNTILPDVFILNLAKSDFNIIDYSLSDISDSNKMILLGKKYNVPEFEIIGNLMKTWSQIKVHFYDDALLKSWKKHLYVLDAYDDEDIIICIDDDIFYKDTFIVTMLKSYNYYGRNFPITPITLNYCQGTYGFCGSGTLYKKKYLANLYNYVPNDIFHMTPEDNILLIVLTINGYIPMPVIGVNYLFDKTKNIDNDSNYGNFVFDDSWWTDYTAILNKENEFLANNFAYRDEMKYAWYPACYNFSYNAVKNYLEKYKDIHNTGPAKLVYDDINDYYTNRFGQNGEAANIKIAYNLNINIEE